MRRVSYLLVGLLNKELEMNSTGNMYLLKVLSGCAWLYFICWWVISLNHGLRKIISSNCRLGMILRMKVTWYVYTVPPSTSDFLCFLIHHSISSNGFLYCNLWSLLLIVVHFDNLIYSYWFTIDNIYDSSLSYYLVE